MKRRRFTEREVVLTLLQQGARIICPRCQQFLMIGELVDREHFHELALGGKDVPENCFYSHASCHLVVTNGTHWTSAGSSKHKIAKAKRLAAGGRKKRGPKMKSRPFTKSPKWKRLPSGRTVRRT